MQTSNSDEGAEMKQCPLCAESIKTHAIRCKHCHADLTDSEGKPWDRRAGLAAVLNVFVVGLGQIYNGQIGIGLAALFLWAVSLAALVALTNATVDNSNGFLLLAALRICLMSILLSVYLAGIWDSYRNSRKRNRPLTVAVKIGYLAWAGLITTIVGYAWWQNQSGTEIANNQSSAKLAPPTSVQHPMDNSEFEKNLQETTDPDVDPAVINMPPTSEPAKPILTASHPSPATGVSSHGTFKDIELLTPSPPRTTGIGSSAKLTHYKLSNDKPGVYRDENVEITFDLQTVEDSAVPTPGSFDPEPVQSFLVSVTNKSQTRILHFYPGSLVTVCDDYGNMYQTEHPQLTDQSNPSSNRGLYPGETSLWKIRFYGKLIPTANSVVLRVWKDDFGNDRSFDAGIPLKSGSGVPYIRYR